MGVDFVGFFLPRILRFAVALIFVVAIVVRNVKWTAKVSTVSIELNCHTKRTHDDVRKEFMSTLVFIIHEKKTLLQKLNF